MHIAKTLITLALFLSTPVVTIAQTHTDSHTDFHSYHKLIERRPLLAHVRLCLEHPSHCETHRDTRNELHPDALLREMRAINLRVNRTIRPMPDPEGQDIWTLHAREGDCEDYALQKQHELLLAGWPSSALRIAVVRGEHVEELHAVLLVRIGNTDWVLDNLTNAVRPWQDTPYEFLFVQSRDNPQDWKDVILASSLSS